MECAEVLLFLSRIFRRWLLCRRFFHRWFLCFNLPGSRLFRFRLFRCWLFSLGRSFCWLSFFNGGRCAGFWLGCRCRRFWRSCGSCGCGGSFRGLCRWWRGLRRRGCFRTSCFWFASTLFRCLISSSSCGCVFIFLCPSTADRRRRRWWFRRRIRLQEFYNFIMCAQLAVQQLQEGFILNLFVLRMFRRDAHLRHLWKRQFLPHQRPLGQEVLDLLLNSGRPRCDRVEKQRIRTRGHHELPGF